MVFDKWKTAFCGFLNPSDDQHPDLDQIGIMQRVDINADESSFLTREFSLFDVQKAVCNIKNNRSAGIDEVLAEILKNGNVMSFYINCATYAMILVRFLMSVSPLYNQ